MAWKAWSGNGSGVAFGSSSSYEKSYFAKLLKLAQLTRGPTEILEIGFGNGGLMAYCQSRGFRVVGTEANPTLVEIARAEGFDAHGAEFIETVPPESFDLIIALDVVEHIDPSQTISFLKACRRALRAEGALVLRFPNGDSPFSVSNFNADITHVNWISADKLRYYARAASFSVFKVLGTPQIILTRSIFHGFYNLCNVPAKWLINALYRLIFYPGRKLNFVAIDLVAILRK